MSRNTAHVRSTLDVLCAYYADRDGNAVVLNAVQVAVYLDGLGRYPAGELERAARVWMGKSRFFPKVSDLLDILRPQIDWSAVTHLAWATVEDAIRRGGAYRGARFSQGAVGETVREVFGTWPIACSFDLDSPGWAIRRQSFLAVFPTIARREHGTVVLRGLHANVEPYDVPQIMGLPTADALEQLEDGHIPRREAKALVAEIRSRFELRPKDTP